MDPTSHIPSVTLFHYLNAVGSSLEAETDQWFNQVRNYLKTNFDSSYETQFLATTPNAFRPNGVSEQTLNLWQGINQRVDVLNRFVADLKK